MVTEVFFSSHDAKLKVWEVLVYIEFNDMNKVDVAEMKFRNKLYE